MLEIPFARQPGKFPLNGWMQVCKADLKTKSNFLLFYYELQFTNDLNFTVRCISRAIVNGMIVAVPMGQDVASLDNYNVARTANYNPGFMSGVMSVKIQVLAKTEFPPRKGELGPVIQKGKVIILGGDQ